MTIFYELAKAAILQKLNQYNVDSYQKDNAWPYKSLYKINHFFSKHTLIGRDLKLSKEKRVVLNKTKKAIEQMASQKNDEMYFKVLMTELNQCESAAQKVSMEKGFSEGRLGEVITSTQNDLKKIYSVLNDFNLLDCSYDKNPLSCIRYYAAMYMVDKKLTDKCHHQIVKTKQAMLKRTLQECDEELKQNQEGDKVPIVLKYISELKSQNKTLCAQKHIGLGYLEECLLNAEQSIKQPNQLYPNIPVMHP